MNWITIIGKAYKRGALAESKSGLKYININLMDRMKNKEETFYFSCVAFGKQAEYIDKYVENGDEVVILGEVKENKKDKKIEVTLNQVIKTTYHPINKTETVLKQETAEQEDIF